MGERKLQIIDRANMSPTQLLVDGSLDDIGRLAEWDEVAYIFPASPELANGDDVSACAGALTVLGPVAQYVLVGPGWPQTGASRFFGRCGHSPSLRRGQCSRPQVTQDAATAFGAQLIVC